MTDLTDSFCERCGARYAFVANGPKGLSLKGARVLAKGLKNFVLTDGQSISDAMELARNEDDHEASTRVAEAFHRTFNFCMSCRQYACDKCWNETAGECLSCSPVDEAEWSLFAETPAADPNQGAAEDAPFTDPILIGGHRPERPPRRRPDPAAWPAADLAEGQQAKTAGSNGKKGHDAARKAADQAAANAWPVADEISAEMTLTAEEMEIVHSHLSQSRSNAIPAAAAAGAAEPQAASQVPLLQEPQTWWNSRVPDEDANRTADWALDDTVTEDRPAHDWELAAAAEPVEEMQAELQAEPSTSEMDLPPVSPKLLRRTSTADDLPSLTPSEPEPQTPESGGLVARLFGRRAPEPEPPAVARPRRASSKRGLPAGESWPHATAWSERPLDGRHWSVDAEAATAGPAPMTADGAFLPELVDAQPVATPEEPAAARSPEPRPTASSKPRHAPAARASRTAQVPSAATHVEIDTRSAAALRLSAMETAMVLPASGEIEPDTAEVGHVAPAAPAAPAHEPAWLRIQREAAEPTPDRSIDVPDRALAADTAERPTTEEPAPAAPEAEEPMVQEQATFDMQVQPPATPWPPLGASWPAREKPGAPWPAPAAADVPAVVAAGQVPASTMAEMWAQSAQEVLNHGSVRVCHHCALPVSTKARFCRRCGTQQA